MYLILVSKLHMSRYSKLLPCVNTFDDSVSFISPKDSKVFQGNTAKLTMEYF